MLFLSRLLTYVNITYNASYLPTTETYLYMSYAYAK